MPKHIYCAVCGQELKQGRKAIPKKGIIVDLVWPHDCEGGVISEDGPKQNILDVLNSIKDTARTVERAEERGPARNPFLDGPTDGRDKDSLAKPVTSTAPTGVKNAVKNMQNTVPEGEIEEDL